MYKDNLERVKNFLQEKWHNVFYVSIYWSQNYWLDTIDSDFDYKAIIIPDIDSIIENSKPFSSSYEFEQWLIDVKDIRAYVESAVKCNVNFIEILNSKYYIWSDELRRFFIPLQKELWQLFLKACYWMILEKNEALRHPYPSIIHKIEKFWYDPKQLHHIVRLRILMERFINWDIWNYLHKWKEKEQLLVIKEWWVSNNDVDFIAENNITIAKNIRDNYVEELRFDAKNEILKKSKEIIKRSIHEKIISQNTNK